MNMFISQLTKMVPLAKGIFIVFCMATFAFILSSNVGVVFQVFCLFVICLSIKKTWFVGFVGFLSGSYDEIVIVDCSRKIAEWLLRFSSAALIPIFVLSLVEDGFIKNKQHIMFIVSFVSMATVFVSLRITKHSSEGIRIINTRDDFRDIIKREYEGVKFEYDELNNAQVKKIIEEYNVNPPSREDLKNYLRPILERHGLLFSEEESMKK